MIAIIPAFNEERALGSLVLRLRQHVHTVIVVDDGSTDATSQVARLAGATVVSHEQNLGYGAAIQSGLRSAQALNPQAVVLLDADGQHRVEDVPVVLGPILEGDADIVVGSRFLDQRSRVPLVRRLPQYWLTALANVGSGVSLTDSQSGLRAFGRQALDALQLRSSSMAAASEMQFLASDEHLRIIEVPVHIRYFNDRKRSLLVHGIDVLNGTVQLISLKHPLLFFGIPGVALVMLGFFLGIDVLERFSQQRILLVGQSIGAVGIFMTGVFSLFFSVVLHALQLVHADLASLKRNSRP